jgi:hypothetical protein
LYIPGGRCRSGWAMIIWSHGAAGEARGQRYTADRYACASEKMILFEVPPTHNGFKGHQVKITDFWAPTDRCYYYRSDLQRASRWEAAFHYSLMGCLDRWHRQCPC